MSASILSLFALLFVLASANAEAPDRFNPLEETWPHDASDLSPDPDIVYGKLSNGMRYALQQNAKPIGEASIRFWVYAGRRNEADDALGVAHFLEHMAFNGSENIAEGNLVKELERRGLLLGPDTNASTGYSRTSYELDLPSVDDDTVDFALFFMREVADRLTIEDAAVERERGVILAEEARKNTPRFHARQARTELLYPHALSTTRNDRKSEAQIKATTPEQLRAFYKAHYRPERTLLVIVGDLDMQVIQSKIEASFSDWENTAPVPSDPDDGYLERLGLGASIFNHEELRTSLSLYDSFAPEPFRDSVAQRLRRQREGMAISIVNRRASKRINEGGASQTLARISRSSNSIGKFLSASIRPSATENWSEALSDTVLEIRTALAFGFQEQELEDLVSAYRYRLEQRVKSAETQTSRGIADSIVRAFESGTVRTTAAESLRLFEQHVATLTAADLHAVFKENWTDFQPFIWAEGPDWAGITSDDLVATYNAAMTAEVEPAETRSRIPFAHTDFGPAGDIRERSRVEDFKIDQIVFDNNVRLNLLQTDFEADSVEIRVTIGEGWSAFPKSKPGLTRLASSLAIGGFEGHKISELSEIFPDRLPSARMSIGSERISFNTTTSASQVLPQMQVWAALVTHAGYRPEWLDRYRDSVEQGFHTIDSTPSGVAGRDIGRLLTSGDPRFGLAPKETYLGYELDEVRQILDPIFATGAIEIGVVGDFEPQEVIEAVQKTFAALPTRNTEHDLTLEAFDMTFPDPARVALTHVGAADQGLLNMAWPTTQTWTHSQWQAYDLIRRIFRSRLRERIREELGLSYTLRTSLSFRELYSPFGYMSVRVTANPEDHLEIEDAVKEIAAELRSGGITADELDRVRVPLLEDIEAGQQRNSDWINLVTYSQTKPDRLDRRRAQQGDLLALDVETLDAAAASLFDPERLHVISIGPETPDEP